MIRFLSIAALCSATLLGQAPLTLSGHIQDAQGASVEGAELRLFRQETGSFRSTVTSASGEYRFDRVEPGSFALQVRKDGFRPAVLSVDIRRQSATAGVTQDVTLEIEGVNQSVVVTAAGEAQALDEVSRRPVWSRTKRS